VTVQSISLAKALPALIIESLKALGYRIEVNTPQTIKAYQAGYDVTWTAGQGLNVVGYNPQEQIIKLNREYGAKAVTWAAQRAGWKVQQTGNNTLGLERR
jgi:hypothetical protein